MDKNAVYKTNSFYWDTKGSDFLGAIVLPFYGAFVSEEKCQLFGDVSGKKMLEVGCGNGQSAYLFSVGLILYINVLFQKIIYLLLTSVISMNLGIRYLLI